MGSLGGGRNDLTGRLAFMKGDGGDIGRAIALRLAADAAELVLADLDLTAGETSATGVRALGHASLAIPTDLSSKAQVTEMIPAADRFGGIDILVNCAGDVARTRL